MNNTTKAEYDLARRMLKGHIPIEEVAAMTNLPLSALEEIRDDVEKDNKEANYLNTLDFKDFDIGPIIADNEY